MPQSNFKATIFSTLVMSFMLFGVSAKAAEKPLLQEGKKTLYQRVLTTPSCELSVEQGKKGKKIAAFSRYYVYQRQKTNNQEWLKVGADSFGNIVGWIKSDCAIAWNMQMSLAFTNPSNRDRLLFFKNRDFLENIINSDEPAKEVLPLRKDLADNKNNPQILAQEPAEYVDFQKNFYLLPILQGEEVMNGQGLYERILEVASVSKKDVLAQKNNSTATNNTQKSGNQPQQVTEFSAAVVFVIDSTISMDPYINRTRDAIEKVYKNIEAENLAKQVKFGLVAFRSSTKAVPKLKYLSKVFVDPNQVKNGADFMQKVASLKQAKVSSKSFNEDSYAGVMQALNDIKWNNFGARYIILITDAGAIESDSPLSSTGLDAREVRLEAEHKGVAIYTLHLKTKAGKKNHDSAKTQYEDLSLNNFINKPLYYPVNAGDINKFGVTIDSLASALTKQVKLAYSGDSAIGSALNISQAPKKVTNPTAKQIEDDAALLGKAMQLAYLGKLKGTQAPPVFKAWISDKDFAKPTISTAQARVLITKSQLSDLSDVVKKIADAANSGLISPTDMFDQLRSVAAAMGRDPNQIKQGSSTKIADLGLLGEYLEGLPYRSQISSIDEDLWKGMSVQEQEKFVRELHSKLNLYRHYNEDQSRWISLSEGSDPRDFVYPVSLEALP